MDDDVNTATKIGRLIAGRTGALLCSQCIRRSKFSIRDVNFAVDVSKTRKNNARVSNADAGVSPHFDDLAHVRLRSKWRVYFTTASN